MRWCASKRRREECVLSVSIYLYFHSRQSLVKKDHTRGDDAAEQVDVVDDWTVPATMLELVLALVDGQPSALPHAAHVLRVASTDSPLTAGERRQTPALGARQRGDVARWYGVGPQVTYAARWRWRPLRRRQRRQRPTVSELRYRSETARLRQNFDHKKWASTRMRGDDMFDTIFSRFNETHERDRQTDRDREATDVLNYDSICGTCIQGALR